MINIVLTILLFSLVMVVFKLFSRFKVVSLHAITINYIVAAILGFVFSNQSLSFSQIIHSNWVIHAAIVGVLFIFVFNLLAIGTQKVGITISTVANKMSLLIPVVFSLIFYSSDKLNLLKAIGIALALIGVYFSSTEGKKLSFDKRYLWLIATIFFVQGCADIVFNHAQKTAVPPNEIEIFFGVLFTFAALAGIIVSGTGIITKKQSFNLNAILFGVFVAIPNYLTLTFFFKSLDTPGLEPSIVYPLVSMGVVLSSAIAGLILFKEKLSVSNRIGIAISILAIGILAYA